MPVGISSYLHFADRLAPAHFNAALRAGVDSFEIFAARHHFDYTQRSAVQEAASWFRSNPVVPTLHMPVFTAEEEAQWSRHTQPTLNLIDREKRNRIAAMDEVKRALEAAESIPFRFCVLHLGRKEDLWSSETLDHSLTAIEHLKAFAAPLGVQLLLENLPGDVATPAHLLEITRVGHFNTVGFCLDIGHAHLAHPLLPGEAGFNSVAHERLREQWGDAARKDGILEAFQTFQVSADRLVALHIHDNARDRDSHLWPATPTPGKGVDWSVVREALAASPSSLAPFACLEVAQDTASPNLISESTVRTIRGLLGLATA